MKGMLMMIGALAGGRLRGLRGALFGAGAGWALGWLLTPLGTPAEAEEEHYLRYPEEEIIDALGAAESEAEVEAAELDDLYRAVSAEESREPRS